MHLVTKRPWPLAIPMAILAVMYNVSKISILAISTTSIRWWSIKNRADCQIYKIISAAPVSIAKITNRVTLTNPYVKYIISLLLIAGVIYKWWRDVHREAAIGHHFRNLQNLIKTSMILFITSEVLFFLGFFWSYYWYALNNKNILDNQWPPADMKLSDTLNPYGLSLINCFILLSSGVSVTFAHFSMFENQQVKAKEGLLVTILFAAIFVGVQLFEYSRRQLTINRYTFGNIFFTITGLHGSHVVVGLIMIVVTYARLRRGHIRKGHHVGAEMSIWYWHFVDVVWLFVYLRLYWWTSYLNYFIQNIFLTRKKTI